MPDYSLVRRYFFFSVGALVPQLITIFDTYWNSPQLYPVQSIIATTLDRDGMQKQFNAIVDPAVAAPWPALDSIDILGYGPTPRMSRRDSSWQARDQCP